MSKKNNVVSIEAKGAKKYRNLEHFVEANKESVTARYLYRIGARPRSLLSAVVEEKSGHYFKDTGRVRFDRNGEAIAIPPSLAPNEDEVEAIKTEFAKIRFPQEAAPREAVPEPKQIKEWGIAPENVFKFLNEAGEVLMIQVRTNETDKELRKYISLTLYDDGEWHVAEPEAGLPIYGLERVRDASTVILHEGAKAARRMHEMVNYRKYGEKERAKFAAHPWADWLSSGVHCGWVGGALASERTDFRIFRRLGVKTLIIVADNDAVGKSAVRSISRAAGITTYMIQFSPKFPAGFDLADEFPEELFEMVGDIKVYTGPTPLGCLVNVTWATRMVKPPGEDKFVPELYDHFRDMWVYVPDIDMFVCKESPWLRYPPPIFNRFMSEFSDTKNLAALVSGDKITRVGWLTYHPYNDDAPEPWVIIGDKRYLNTYTPSLIKEREGDVSLFLEFMDWIFPHDLERKQVMRWIATLIARPQMKMKYSLMMVSETQGVGKTTLCTSIVAPIVGWHNVSQPSEETIVNSGFNDWIANKRLAVVSELYSGNSWRAYHKLKDSISDVTIQVNEKYVKPYMIQNWIHAMVCSNSYRAMNVDNNDRRWLIPKLREEKWKADKFADLYKWLRLGGLSYIKAWALEYGDYVGEGEEAPMTKTKRMMVDESRSEAQKEALALVEAMDGQAVACTMVDIKFWLRDRCQGKVYDTDAEIRRTTRDAGALWTAERIRVGSNAPQYVLISREGFKLLEEGKIGTKNDVGVIPATRSDTTSRNGSTFNNKIKELLRKPGEIVTPEM